MKLPFRIMVEFSKRANESLFYDLEVVVCGSPSSQTVALVEMNLNEGAKIVEVRINGLEMLPDETLQKFLIRLFELAYDKMLLRDGSAIDWTISDISGLLEDWFPTDRAATIKSTISRLTTPDTIVANTCVVTVG
jgi:hypothetical protein